MAGFQYMAPAELNGAATDTPPNERLTAPVPDRMVPNSAVAMLVLTVVESTARNKTVHFDESRRAFLDQPVLRLRSLFRNISIASALRILWLEENEQSPFAARL